MRHPVVLVSNTLGIPNIYDGGMIIYVATEFWYASIPLVLLIPPPTEKEVKGQDGQRNQ